MSKQEKVDSAEAVSADLYLEHEAREEGWHVLLDTESSDANSVLALPLSSGCGSPEPIALPRSAIESVTPVGVHLNWRGRPREIVFLRLADDATIHPRALFTRSCACGSAVISPGTTDTEPDNPAAPVPHMLGESSMGGSGLGVIVPECTPQMIPRVTKSCGPCIEKAGSPIAQYERTCTYTSWTCVGGKWQRVSTWTAKEGCLR